MLPLLAIIAQLQAAATPGQPLSERDSVIALTQARVNASAFVKVWRYYWESSENLRWGHTRSWPAPNGAVPLELSETDSVSLRREHSRVLATEPLRMQLLHCHPDPPPQRGGGARAGGGGGGRGGGAAGLGGIGGGVSFPTSRGRGRGADVYYRIAEYIIDNPEGLRAICPSWYPPEHSVPWDERLSIDAGIIPEVREPIVAARGKLLDRLDSLALLLPGDEWLLGQRVRFALDQADTARAVAAVRGCKAARWWCLVMEGYLSAPHLDKIPESDALFRGALSAMPPSERCVWNDLRQLLDEPGRAAYSQLSCAARDSVNERIWWLADPLYLETGNERRVEHYARVTMLRLRMGTDYAERWDLDPVTGGLATQHMLVRYGWPSLSWWGGQSTDVSHYGYLGITRGEMGPLADDIQDHGRFATAEYSRPRFSTVGAWSAVEDPFDATGDEWVLSMAAATTIRAGDTLWWPREHFDRQGSPLVQLWHQTGLFRRDTAAYFASSSYLFPSDFGGAAGDSLRGGLFLSTGPDHMQFLPFGGIVGRSVVVKAVVPARPQLVSLELASRSASAHVARDRYGIKPPPALSSLRAGEIAISAPVLIQPLEPGTSLPPDMDAILNRMYGNTVFKAPQQRLAIYWETYGVGQSDTVELSIRLERHEPPPGVLRRIGFRLGIGERRDGGVTVGWREPNPDRSVIPIPGRVPIQGRSVTLDVSHVEAGDYSLIVSVRRPNQPAVTASREFWLVE